MGAHRAEQLLRRQLQRDRQGELGDEIGGPVTAQLSPQQGAALPVEYQLDKAPLPPLDEGTGVAPQHTLAGGTGDAPGPGLVGGESHLGQLWAGVDAGGDGGHSAEGGAAQQEVGHKAPPASALWASMAPPMASPMA